MKLVKLIVSSTFLAALFLATSSTYVTRRMSPLGELTAMDRADLAYLRQSTRPKRSGSGDVLQTLKTKIGQGIKSKLGMIGKASAGAAAHFSSSLSGGHHHHGHHEDSKFDLFSFKKSVLYTLLQAVKAIKGGVIAIKGQLIKGGGQLLTHKGNILKGGGDALTTLGKSIATSAFMVLPHMADEHDSSEHYDYVPPSNYGHTGPSYHPSGPEIHHSAPSGPSGHHHHHGHQTAPSAPAHEYGYPTYYKLNSVYDGKKAGRHDGIVILKKIPKGQRKEKQQEHEGYTEHEPQETKTPDFKPITDEVGYSLLPNVGNFLASASGNFGQTNPNEKPINYLQYFNVNDAPPNFVTPVPKSTQKSPEAYQFDLYKPNDNNFEFKPLAPDNLEYQIPSTQQTYQFNFKPSTPQSYQFKLEPNTELLTPDNQNEQKAPQAYQLQNVQKAPQAFQFKFEPNTQLLTEDNQNVQKAPQAYQPQNAPQAYQFKFEPNTQLLTQDNQNVQKAPQAYQFQHVQKAPQAYQFKLEPNTQLLTQDNQIVQKAPQAYQFQNVEKAPQAYQFKLEPNTQLLTQDNQIVQKAPQAYQFQSVQKAPQAYQFKFEPNIQNIQKAPFNFKPNTDLLTPDNQIPKKLAQFQYKPNTELLTPTNHPINFEIPKTQLPISNDIFIGMKLPLSTQQTYPLYPPLSTAGGLKLSSTPFIINIPDPTETAYETARPPSKRNAKKPKQSSRHPKPEVEVVRSVAFEIRPNGKV